MGNLLLRGGIAQFVTFGLYVDPEVCRIAVRHPMAEGKAANERRVIAVLGKASVGAKGEQLTGFITSTFRAVSDLKDVIQIGLEFSLLIKSPEILIQWQITASGLRLL